MFSLRRKGSPLTPTYPRHSGSGGYEVQPRLVSWGVATSLGSPPATRGSDVPDQACSAATRPDFTAATSVA